MADDAERGAGNSPAVTRSIRILDLLAEARGVPRTLTEISRELGLAKSSVSNLCAALEEGGLVRRSSAGYLLGGAPSSSVARSSQASIRFASSTASAKIRGAAQPARPDRSARRRAVLSSPSSKAVSVPHVGHVGDRYPASVTAVGTALLSELTPSQVAELYWDTSNLVGFTKKSTSTLAELQEKLKRTRERGYAVDEGEVHPTVLGLAIPIPVAPENRPSPSASPSSTPPAPLTNATPS